MADPNGPPRRVSMAYLLGFSNKPFKDPPAPRSPHSSGLAQLMSSPGNIVEWAASDGRKGKISGAGKQRLTATSLAKVPSEKRSVKEALSASGGGNKDAKNKTDEDNPHGWTADDDKKLMDWKNEFGTAPWAGCVAAIGKPEFQCKERFKKIRPVDWKPPNTKGKGGGGNQKSSKKDKKQNQNAGTAGGNDTNGAAENGGDDPFANTVGFFDNNSDENNDNSGDGNNAWNADGGNDNNAAWDNTGGNTGNNDWNNTPGWGAPAQDAGNTSGGNPGTTGGAENAWETGGAAGGGSGDATDPWNTGAATGGGAVGGWDTNKNQNNDGGNTGTGDNPVWGGADAWPGNPASAKSSTKANTQQASNHHESKSRSHHDSHHKSRSHHGRSIAAPRDIEVTPDSTFSADDLRIVARILQQDCAMVWNRVSWRFRDKTGKNLHPNVFEKKITGHVEGKGSERGDGRAK